MVVRFLWGKFMIYENIKKCCAAKGVTVRKLERDLEFGRGSVSKFDEHDPSVGKMNMIAGYLGVTVDDLISEDYPVKIKTGSLADQMYSDPDMRDIYIMKQNMSAARFALYKKLLEDVYKADIQNGKPEN